MPQEYKLTEEEAALAAWYQEALRGIQADFEALMRSIVRVRKLEGNWEFDRDRPGMLIRHE